MKQLGTLAVGGVSYCVRFGKPDDPKAFGECDSPGQAITIAEGTKGDRLEEVLMHEIVHALLFESGAAELLELDDKKEETLISILAPHMCKTLTPKWRTRG